jgi:hypothetical protein
LRLVDTEQQGFGTLHLFHTALDGLCLPAGVTVAAVLNDGNTNSRHRLIPITRTSSPALGSTG